MSEEETSTRRWPRVVAWTFGGLAVLLVLAGAAISFVLRGSLPTTAGELTVEGLSGPVVITRDGFGVPTVSAEDRLDVAFASGFLHGQERFFQMDLTRRAAAGELSGLFGARALGFDKSRRIHRSRQVVEQAMATWSAEHVALVERYAAGVNAGLEALDARPFEYQLLRLEPRPWAPVDTGLVIMAMFYDLQDETARFDRMRGVMREALPLPLAEWLVPRGSKWDAPIDGRPMPEIPMPGPEVVDLRTMPQWQSLRDGKQARVEVEAGGVMIGSNSWAVAGSLSEHGGAMVANDMHLALRVPIIWYRSAWQWKHGDETRRIEGVTLPGGPAVVVGSNGEVAWAFTNSQIDSVDAIPLELEGGGYRTPDGVEPFATHTETIEVADGAPITFEHRWTRWGPVIDADIGRPTAVRWIGHDPAALNLAVIELELADGLDAALDIANRGGVPPQNFLAADATGRIGWTIMGYVPERFGPPVAALAPAVADPIDRPAGEADGVAPDPDGVAPDPDGVAPDPDAVAPPAEPPLFAGYDGRVPQPWSDGRIGWRGRLPAARYPRIVDPEEGLLWTANARMVGGADYAVLGEGRYALGARQKQIRDGLRERARAGKLDEADMLEIQLDDRALFLERWRDHLVTVLDSGEATPLRARAKLHLATGWTGRAAVESVAYRLVHDLRLAILEAVFAALTAPAGALHPQFVYAEPGAEAPLWQMISAEPAHLLHPGYPSWKAWQLAVIDEALAGLTDGAKDPLARLDTRTWGESNTIAIRHPMADAVPLVGGSLAAPREPLPGDSHMPRVQGADDGASERLAVSPGKEEKGYLLLPGGQSGNPLSEHFLDQYRHWATGTRQPFRPGPVKQTLTLRPAR